MICSYCGREVADVKKTCPYCGEVLTGWTMNNVTGELGYRNEDGSFTPFFKKVRKETMWDTIGRWMKRYFTRIAWILTGADVGTLVYFDITWLVRVALALMIWVSILAIGLISVELYKYIKDSTDLTYPGLAWQPERRR